MGYGGGGVEISIGGRKIELSENVKYIFEVELRGFVDGLEEFGIDRRGRKMKNIRVVVFKFLVGW